MRIEVLKEMDGAVITELGAEQTEILTHSVIVLTGVSIVRTQVLGELLKDQIRTCSGVNGATP